VPPTMNTSGHSQITPSRPWSAAAAKTPALPGPQVRQPDRNRARPRHALDTDTEAFLTAKRRIRAALRR
jgi:hypothetical protein